MFTSLNDGGVRCPVWWRGSRKRCCSRGVVHWSWCCGSWQGWERWWLLRWCGPGCPTAACWRWLVVWGPSGVSGALIVLAVAATLNYQNGWYASWSDVARDLTHTPPTIKQVAVAGVFRPSQPYDFAQAYAAGRGAQRKYRIQRASFAAGPLAHAHPGPLGQYVTVHVPGLGDTAGKDAGQVLVWLPPGYTSPAQKTRTYPVIEASGVNPEIWVATPNACTSRTSWCLRTVAPGCRTLLW